MEKVKTRALAALSLVLAVAFMLASTSALQHTAATRAVTVGTPVSLGEVLVLGERKTVPRDEILWLARCIYSETKRPKEQELVAWVVRNRVETNYRGRTSYRSVVLDPWQFSAFNANSPKRRHYISLKEGSSAAGWQRALEIAERVAHAPASARPFPRTTRHFYSERSMVGGRRPGWARNRRPVKVDVPVDPRRFRFYANVS